MRLGIGLPNTMAHETDRALMLEWARTAEDILWRRSKLGLRFSAEETADLARYLATVIVTGQAN